LLEAAGAASIRILVFALSKQLCPGLASAGLIGAALFVFHPEAVVYAVESGRQRAVAGAVPYRGDLACR